MRYIIFILTTALCSALFSQPCIQRVSPKDAPSLTTMEMFDNSVTKEVAITRAGEIAIFNSSTSVMEYLITNCDFLPDVAGESDNMQKIRELSAKVIELNNKYQSAKRWSKGKDYYAPDTVRLFEPSVVQDCPTLIEKEGVELSKGFAITVIIFAIIGIIAIIIISLRYVD